MKILDITVKDFLAIGDAKFGLDDKGLVLLAGENADDPSAISNGAGKSSLMDAVCWGLWGSTARGVTGADVIREGAKEAVVCIRLGDDGPDEWVVLRKRLKSKTELRVDQLDGWGVTPGGTITNLTGGTEKLTQEKIAKILGCSEEVFRAGVYVGQESLPDLPMMTDKQLKELIEEAAGVKSLEMAYARARLRLAGATGAHLEAKSNREIARRDYTNAVANRDAADQRVKDYHDTIKVQLANLHSEMSAVERVAEEMEKEQSGSPSIGDIIDKLAAVDAKFLTLNVEREEERRLDRILQEHTREVAKLQALAQDHALAVRASKARADKVDAMIGTPCTSCGSELTASHLCAVQKDADEALAKTAATLTGDLAALQTARAAVTASQGALDAHRGTLRDPSALTAERKSLQTDLEDARHVMQKIKELHTQASVHAESIKRLMSTANPHLPEFTKWIAALAALDKIMAGLDETVEQTAQAQQDEENAVKVFGPAGVRAHILDEVTPALNERTAVYLSALTDGNIQAEWSTISRTAKGELRERFAIDVTHSAHGRGFRNISGGEKRKVRLACALALQDLVASRATKPFQMWVADEIDTALDAAGLERLMTVLAEKARERGTVIVVSHQSLKDWIPTVWTVRKEGGKSELVM